MIKIKLNIEGSLINAESLFCQRALLFADSLLFTKEALSARKPLGSTLPQDENLPNCAPSGLEPPTYHILGVNID